MFCLLYLSYYKNFYSYKLEDLIRQIEGQIQFNRSKNLLCKETLSDFGFSPSLTSYIKEHLCVLKNIDAQQEEILLNRLVDKAIETLCGANQYYYFNSFDRITFKKIYQKLHSEIKSISEHEIEQGLQDLAKGHYRTLQG